MAEGGTDAQQNMKPGVLRKLRNFWENRPKLAPPEEPKTREQIRTEQIAQQRARQEAVIKSKMAAAAQIKLQKVRAQLQAQPNSS